MAAKEPRSSPVARHAFKWPLPGKGRTVLRFIAVLVVLPGLLAALGAIVEVGVYAEHYRTWFYPKYMPIAGLIAAPFILLRMFWQWPKYLLQLEMFLFLVQSVGYFVAVSNNVIVGSDFYIANLGIRNMLTKSADGSEFFRNVTTDDQVWTWLEHVVSTVFNTDEGRTISGRTIQPGRLLLLASLKIRQHRVTPVCCSGFYRTYHTACYPMFSGPTESRETFGTNLTFSYVTLSQRATTGHLLDIAQYSVPGKFSSYPLAGFSMFFSPAIRKTTAMRQLEAMRHSNWIDQQTRSIVVEAAIASPDFLDAPVWFACVFLVERNKIGLFTASQPSVHINYLEHINFVGDILRGGEPLDACTPNPSLQSVTSIKSPSELYATVNAEAGQGVCDSQGPGQHLVQFFLFIFPVILYRLLLAVHGLCADWRKHISQPFHLTDAAWTSLLLVVLAYWIHSYALLRCKTSYITQPVFAGLNESSLEGAYSSSASVLDFFPYAHVETQSRRFLAISIFVHFFNSLRFIIRLESLGIMVRTLWFSAASLLSFSISFTIIFFGFVLMFYYIYSMESAQFSSLSSTVISLWIGMLGEVQLTGELLRTQSWTIALFIVFTFISAFVLLTLIISIVSNAHSTAVKTDRAAAATRPPLRNDGDDAGDVHEQAASYVAAEDCNNLISERQILLDTVAKWKTLISKRQSSRVAPRERPVGQYQEMILDESAMEPAQPDRSNGSRSTRSANGSAATQTEDSAVGDSHV